MSKSNNIRRTIGLLFVFAICVVFVGADLFVSSAGFGAQNANSGEMTRGGMMTSNTNTGGTKMAAKRHRKRRRARAATATDSGMMANAGVASMSSSDMTGMQMDVSGTYNGTVNYPEGGITGPATLTITGNNFVLAPDGGGSSIGGRATAVVTRGYVAVTMMFGDLTPPPVTQSPPPLPAVSLRARLVGGHVTLNSVPGEKREFSFTSAMSMKTKPHRKRHMSKKHSMRAASAPTEPERSMEIKPPTP